MKAITIFVMLGLAPYYFSQSIRARSYYRQIAFGNEFTNDPSGEYKWTKDIKIYILGNPEIELISELDRVVTELNLLIDPISLSVVSDQKESNVLLLFGSKQDFIDLEPSIENDVKSNEGLFIVFHTGVKSGHTDHPCPV